MSRIFGYVKKVLSSNEFLSFSRHGSLVSLIVILGLNIFHALASWHKTGIPEAVGRDEWIGQGVFVTSLYGTGKINESIQKFASDAVPSAAPGTSQGEMPAPK